LGGAAFRRFFVTVALFEGCNKLVAAGDFSFLGGAAFRRFFVTVALFEGWDDQ
jgi:hypothetical protein